MAALGCGGGLRNLVTPSFLLGTKGEWGAEGRTLVKKLSDGKSLPELGYVY